MAVIQCERGHFYDNHKSSFCPYCAKMNTVPRQEMGFEEQLTSYYSMPEEEMDDGAEMTQAYGEEVGEYEKTIGIFSYPGSNALTAGWIVCISGPMKGKSYTVNVGRNFAGRSFEMDIPLTDDNEISREKHFSIVFDPKSVAFYLINGNGRTYINDENVSDTKEMHDGDIITAGQSKYVFVPFCKEDRLWE